MSDNAQPEEDWYGRAQKAELEVKRLQDRLDLMRKELDYYRILPSMTDAQRISFWQGRHNDEKRVRQMAEESRDEWLIVGISGWSMVLAMLIIALADKLW